MKRSDFLQRIIGIAGFGSFNLQTLITKRKIYLQQFFVAGFRFYKGMELLPYMNNNDLLELRREASNEYDDCAIALYWQQEKIGFIPADLNKLLAKLMDANALPLLGMITHLNKEVKPWENVMAAIYFLQDETIEIAPHAAYLQQLTKPVYNTIPKAQNNKLFEDVFDVSNRIVNVDAIELPEIKAHYKKYFNHKKYMVMYKGQPHVHAYTDDIYSFMYNVQPIQWVTADDGEKYLLFKFETNPDDDQ